MDAEQDEKDAEGWVWRRSFLGWVHSYIKLRGTCLYLYNVQSNSKQELATLKPVETVDTFISLLGYKVVREPDMKGPRDHSCVVMLSHETRKNYTFSFEPDQSPKPEAWLRTLWSRTRAPRLRDFVPFRKLGDGGTAEVFLVKERESAELLALKVIRKKSAHGNLAAVPLKQLLMESGALQTLTNHPYIAGVKYCFEDSNAWYMAMEFCPGGDLFGVTERTYTKKDFFRMPVVQLWAAQLVLALIFMHERGFVHRDLKLENILLDEHYHARLADFGLSSRLADKAGSSSSKSSSPAGSRTNSSSSTSKTSSPSQSRRTSSTPRRSSHSNTKTALHVTPEDLPIPATTVEDIDAETATMQISDTLDVDSPHDTGIRRSSFVPAMEENVMQATAPNIERIASPNVLGLAPMQRLKTFCGTSDYIAPEIITSDKKTLTGFSGYGMEVDWWALGVVLFQLITGQNPFAGRNNQRLFQSILKDSVRFPSFLSDPKRMSPELEDLILKLLVKDPAKRLGKDHIRDHPFFDGLDWVDLEEKTEVPTILGGVKIDEKMLKKGPLGEDFKAIYQQSTSGQDDKWQLRGSDGAVTMGFTFSRTWKHEAEALDRNLNFSDGNLNVRMRVSPAQLLAIANKMSKGLPVKDRQYHFSRYKRCFIGQEAVGWMIREGIVTSEVEAIRIGNMLLAAGVFSHVTNDHAFKNAYLFYRMNTSYTIQQDTAVLEKQCKACRDEVEVRDHHYHLRVYPNCFLGKDLVSYLVKKKMAPNRKAALKLGNEMIVANLIFHVCDEHMLVDKPLFYRFAEDKDTR